MNAELIWEYIDPQLVIVVPMLWGIGMAVKKSSIENRFIPILLMFCAWIVVTLHLMSTRLVLDSRSVFAMLFAVSTQGSVVWLAAWMGYEKLLKDREENR